MDGMPQKRSFPKAEHSAYLILLVLADGSSDQKKYFPYFHLYVWTLNIALWFAAFMDGKAGEHDREPDSI